MRREVPSEYTPRAILFDAVGTLIAPDPPVAEAYHAAARRFGSQLPMATIRLRFRAAMARQEAHDAHALVAHRTDLQRELQRWRTIVSEVIDDAADPEGLFQSLWEHFAQPAHWRLYDDVAPCWRRLSAAGFTLGIASNFDDRLDAICNAHELLAACPRFISSQVGCKKPGLEFFRSIERSLQLPPEKIMLVGDDLLNDAFAAQRAGWRAVVIDRGNEQPMVPAGVPIIQTLNDLVAEGKCAEDDKS